MAETQTATAPLDKKYEDVSFYLTSFGPFGKVIDNPTSITLRELTEEDKAAHNIIDTRVLEVSIEGVRAYYGDICAKLRDFHAQNPNKRIIVVHCGVYSGLGGIQVEQFGYNNATFRIPDVRGNTCQEQKIFDTYEFDAALQTQIPVQSIVTDLKAQYPFAIAGNDPGRYICNYIYCHALHLLHGECQTTGLFVHFCDFEELQNGKAVHKSFLLDLLKKIRAQYTAVAQQQQQ